MIQTRPEGETLVHRAAQAFAAYRSGDRASLDELVVLLTPLLWHTVRSEGVDPVAAEDVVQTIWMRLLHSTDSIRDPQTVTKWLLTAARHEAWRVTKRSRSDMGEVTALRDTRQRQLWEHVRHLPERCRELIRVMAFADRPDYPMLAEILGMPVGTIGPARGRCVAKLRHALASDPQWEGGAVPDDLDRTIAELAERPLDDVDAATMARVREVYEAADGVPPELVERVNFSLALDEVYDEVARMTRVPLDAPPAYGEQDGARTETLTFSADRLTATVTVSRIGPGRLRLDGWLAPSERLRVCIRLPDRGEREVVADDQGRFSFPALEGGFGQLSFHPADAEDANAVVTPLFQLL